MWSPSTIRRQLSLLLRVTAVAAAFICVLATAPAASARSVTGEYSPAATLTTEAPVIFPGAADASADALVDTPLLVPAPAPAPTEPTTAAAAPVAPAPDPRQVAIATAIEAARSKLGAPYSYGSAGPYAFDCSGFTRWVYQQAGITLAHYSGAQWANTIHIPLDQLQPGDLVFNWGFGGGDPDHVGLYIGDGMMIHAPNSGGSVRYDSIWWWTGASIAAARLP
jgi:cell wall-associated NlpC family hydrolase